MSTDQSTSYAPTTEEFEALLNETLSEKPLVEGSVIQGTVVDIFKEYAFINIGLKTEGRVMLKEFEVAGSDTKVSIGDKVEVFVDSIENSYGEAVLSRDKARSEESWVKLEKMHANDERVEGVIFGRVRGGFTVDLDGVVAFLPGSQADIRPIRDITPLLDIVQPFVLLKMDKKRGNIVVSRRAILEEARAVEKAEVIKNMHEGQEVEGIVKNITDYGAFVDLGGIDGLLHSSDISWKRISHPTDVLTLGDTIKVQVIKINPETNRISLGMKQLSQDPWANIDEKYALGSRVKGVVTNITDYGVFIEIESGIEGLVHVSEMSWVKKNIHPSKMVSTTQEVEVSILSIDEERRRISLGIKQCHANPWEEFSAKNGVGSKISGVIKNVTEFGMFVGLEGDMDGMVHLSDLAWNEDGEVALAKYNKGDTVEAMVLNIDLDKERVSLGVKQLSNDPFAFLSTLSRGQTITCEVTDINDGGVEVKVGDTILSSFIRRQDLSMDRLEQRPDRFNIGDKVDASVMSVDADARKVSLSIKSLEIAEEREAVKQYGSSDSGASLGDILGVALSESKKEDKE
jgi:small subunit ribosomal protein S1